jgi:hypothetical protein
VIAQDAKLKMDLRHFTHEIETESKLRTNLNNHKNRQEQTRSKSSTWKNQFPALLVSQIVRVTVVFFL